MSGKMKLNGKLPKEKSLSVSQMERLNTVKKNLAFHASLLVYILKWRNHHLIFYDKYILKDVLF